MVRRRLLGSAYSGAGQLARFGVGQIIEHLAAFHHVRRAAVHIEQVNCLRDRHAVKHGVRRHDGAGIIVEGVEQAGVSGFAVDGETGIDHWCSGRAGGLKNGFDPAQCWPGNGWRGIGGFVRIAAALFTGHIILYIDDDDCRTCAIADCARPFTAFNRCLVFRA